MNDFVFVPQETTNYRMGGGFGFGRPNRPGFGRPNRPGPGGFGWGLPLLGGFILGSALTPRYNTYPPYPYPYPYPQPYPYPYPYPPYYYQR